MTENTMSLEQMREQFAAAWPKHYEWSEDDKFKAFGGWVLAMSHLSRPVSESKPVAWMTTESIRHLEKQNGVAHVPAWNVSGDGSDMGESDK